MFGNYIDIYDIAQAVEDKITVKIYYESRLAKVNLTEEGRALVEQFDTELESPSESDEVLSDADEAKAKWTTLEKIVGNPERIKNVANDIVRHFEARQEVFEGKAIIVAMSRRIAVDLYDAIRKYLVGNNYVDAIIQLPSNLFLNVTISVDIMLLRKNKADSGIMFVDASGEYVKVTKNNRLTEANIQRIVSAVADRKDVDHFCRLVPNDEVGSKENAYNLSVSTYTIINPTTGGDEK